MEFVGISEELKKNGLNLIFQTGNSKFILRILSQSLETSYPKGSILGPLLFLLHINDMPQAVDCELLLYADDTCLIFQDKDITKIEMALNKYFSVLCD